MILDSEQSSNGENNKPLTLSLNAEMMNLGFVMSDTLCGAINELNAEQTKRLAGELISELRLLKGAHVSHKPMYPNFPEQVMDASNLELYANALTHYWSSGQWLPEYHSLPKPYAFEATKFKEISLEDEGAFKGIFTQLFMSNDSLSEEDKSVIEWFMLNYPQSELTFPETIPFQENKSVAVC